MNNKIVFLSALLCIGNSVASAQDTPWYAGARIGATHYNNFEDNSSNSLADDNGFGAGLFVGHNFNDWFALETGYTYLGKLKTSDDINTTTQALELVAKFTWHATDPLAVFAKAGGALYYTEADTQTTTPDDSGLSGTAGLGIEYYFTNNFSTRLEYQYYRSLNLDDSAYKSEWDTHLVALGFIYNWGKQEPITVKQAPIDKPLTVEKLALENKAVAGKVATTEPAIAPVVAENATMLLEKTATVHFATNKSTLTASEMKQLQPIIKHLTDYPKATIDVIGHADSRGTSAYNQKLSELRAKSVTNYLINEHAIAAERIATSALGESQPIATNATKQGQAKNRRVAISTPSVTITVR